MNTIDNFENIFAMLCLKLKQQGQSISNGKVIDRYSITTELDDLVGNAFFILWGNQENENIVSIVYDLLNLIDENDIKQILPIYVSKHKQKLKKSEGVSKTLAYLAVLTANDFGRSGHAELKQLLLERVCILSKQKNGRNQHRELVLNILNWLGSIPPEIPAYIASINKEYYEREQDEYAAVFWGFYGSLLGELLKYREATECLNKSYVIVRSIYGENDWRTLQAKCNFLSSAFMHSDDKHSREALEQFVNDIENNKYNHIDQNQQRSLEGQALLALLTNQNNMINTKSYEHYLSLFESFCEKYGTPTEPCFNQRCAKMLRGQYFCKTGDFLLAEKAFLEAIECEIPETVRGLFTIPQIKVELLMSYRGQNDIRKILPLLEELMDLLNSDPQETGLTEEYKYRILTTYSIMEAHSAIGNSKKDNFALGETKAWLHDQCAAIQNSTSEFPNCIGAYIELILSSMLWAISSNTLNTSEYNLYFETLNRIGREKQRFPINQRVRVTLCLTITELLNRMNDPRAEKYITYAVNLADKTILPPSLRITALVECALTNARVGKPDIAHDYAGKALSIMEGMWKSCVRYINDERLQQVITLTQIQFLNLYSMLRTIEDAEAAYEKVLQFKELASLAIRERNRIIHTFPNDRKLLKKIRSVQDRIAVIEAESVFRDNTDEYVNLREKLRSLEAEFAQRFPKSSRFVSISYENVKRAIPDNAVVIEYFMCDLDFGKTRSEEGSTRTEAGFDVFISQKKDGISKFSKISIKNEDRIMAKAEEFVELLQEGANGTKSIDQRERVNKRINELRPSLYKDLIVPILPYVEGFETVYIAPAEYLTNLPFEILYDDNQQKIEDNHTVIKIECARDFLFKVQSGDSPKESLIIGNPTYELNEQDLGARRIDDTDNSRLVRKKISQLPFSQAEAERIGRYLGARCYTRNDASKKLLFTHEKYKVIHLATHGYFDNSENEKEMYTSCLLFSGVYNWLEDGRVSEKYENGVLTSDEISRLDFKGTELVVLSACLTGMNTSMISQGLRGLIGAFSAAGAHYVISHLWEAKDLTTPIFMDAFYYQYVVNKQPPPQALSLAKQYMQRVTIGELKQNHWLDIDRYDDLDQSSKSDLVGLRNLPVWFKPFEDEVYWAGFACYQCY